MGLEIDEAEYKALLEELESVPEQLDDAIYEAFDALARECENEINTNVRQGWQDRTGNLFSSIGLALAKDGRIVRYYGFKGKGTEGKAAGWRLTFEMARENPEGWSILAVAGMYYAEYMEARGVVVLTSVERLIEQGAESILRDIEREFSGNED